MDNLFDSEGGLMLLATVAGAVFAFAKGTAWYKAVAATRVQKALKCVQVGVELTYQEYVQALKDGRQDGTLTPEERAQARARAKRIAIDYGLKQGVDVVRELTHEYLDVAISQAVKRAKAGAAILALLLCVGLTGCATVPTITVTYPDGRVETRTDTAAVAAYVEAARLTADTIKQTIVEVEQQKADSEALADKEAAADAAARRAFWLDVLNARRDLDQGAQVAVKTAKTEVVIEPKE